MKFILILFISFFASELKPVESCKGETKDGKKEGVWKCYYDDGTMSQEGSYVSDKKQGIWKLYHHNGKLALEGKFIDDVEKGIWQVYDDEGKKVDEIDYGT